MAARSRIALLGVAAILIQAILFGWHHHALALGRSGPAAIVSHAGEPLSPAATEDLCDICSILHHQNAAPLAFATPVRPPLAESAIDQAAAVFQRQALRSGFHARAPPRA